MIRVLAMIGKQTHQDIIPIHSIFFEMKIVLANRA